jgi:hypothetical protein
VTDPYAQEIARRTALGDGIDADTVNGETVRLLKLASVEHERIERALATFNGQTWEHCADCHNHNCDGFPSAEHLKKILRGEIV